MQYAITLTQQLKYYKEYQSKLAAVAGRAKARSILSGALYVVSTGTGDFLQNYYHNASLSRRYDVDRYGNLNLLITSASSPTSPTSVQRLSASSAFTNVKFDFHGQNVPYISRHSDFFLDVIYKTIIISVLIQNMIPSIRKRVNN